MSATPISKAYDRAVRMLALRARTVAEVRNDLSGRGFASPVVEEVVLSLLEEGLLNEEAFARGAVISGQEHNKGRERIYTDLRRRGIPRALAEDSLERYFDPERERLAVEKLIAEGAKATRITDRKARSDVAISRASRRGFSASSINAALKHTKGETLSSGGLSFLDSDNDLP